MGLFGKARAGSLKASDGSGHRFVWIIPKFSTYSPGTTIDSDNVTCFTKVKFHFHMSIGTNGDVGLYIHYKSPPIPKYSYYFENDRKEVMRQHTAHTIPAETERCGHWNVCNRRDMTEFLGSGDTLTVRFVFDDDTVSVKRIPEKNTISVLWTIQSLFDQNLNPYSSRGFFIDNTLLVIRLDIKRSTPSVIARYDPRDIEKLVFFLFCRKGKIPPHSIELLDSAGAPFVKAERKTDGTAQTLIVDRKLVSSHIGANGVMFVKVDLSTGGNPIESLFGAGGPALGGPMEDKSDKESTKEKPQQVELGENKETYDVMDD